MNTFRAKTTYEASSLRTYSLADLCKMFGFSARQVRDFRAKGALPPPKGTGRAAYYTDEHVERLSVIKPLFDAGISVSRIANRCSAHKSSIFEDAIDLMEVSAERWDRVRIAPGLEVAVHFSTDLESRRTALIRRLVSEAKRFIAQPGD